MHHGPRARRPALLPPPLHRLSARGIPIVYDNRYQHSISGVPLDPLRGDKVLGALEEAGLLAPTSCPSRARPRS